MGQHVWQLQYRYSQSAKNISEISSSAKPRFSVATSPSGSNQTNKRNETLVFHFFWAAYAFLLGFPGNEMKLYRLYWHHLLQTFWDNFKNTCASVLCSCSIFIRFSTGKANQAVAHLHERVASSCFCCVPTVALVGLASHFLLINRICLSAWDCQYSCCFPFFLFFFCCFRFCFFSDAPSIYMHAKTISDSIQC